MRLPLVERVKKTCGLVPPARCSSILCVTSWPTFLEKRKSWRLSVWKEFNGGWTRIPSRTYHQRNEASSVVKSAEGLGLAQFRQDGGKCSVLKWLPCIFFFIVFLWIRKSRADFLFNKYNFAFILKYFYHHALPYSSELDRHH